MTIKTPSGNKPLASLKVGDKVIGKNGVENTITAIEPFVRGWFESQERDFEFMWYRINNSFEVFGNQNIFVAQGGYTVCHANELQVGWKIYDGNGNQVTITSIQPIQFSGPWYKIDISGDHSFIADGLLVHNASRYWVGGGSSANWNATSNTNWSATDGGANNASVPASTDDVVFNANGNSSSTISATITILSLTITSGYTSTMTHNSVLTIAGNVTFGANYTIAGSSNITISAASTITSNGKVWPNGFLFSGSNTVKTLSDNLTVGGTLTLANSVVLNGSGIYIAGGLSVGTGTYSGTTNINLTGGTWSGSGILQNNLSIDGNVTVSGNVNYNTGTLTADPSAVVTTTGSTLTIGASTTLNTAGISWNNITLSGASTITINSLLLVSGTLNGGTTITYAGTYGFTVGTFLLQTTSNGIQTFTNGNTYTITTALIGFLSRVGSILTFTSSHASNKAILTLQNGATCNVLANFTRIDASGGRTINTFNGTVTDCLNVRSFNDLQTVAHHFIT